MASTVVAHSEAGGSGGHTPRKSLSVEYPPLSNGSSTLSPPHSSPPLHPSPLLSSPRPSPPPHSAHLHSPPLPHSSHLAPQHAASPHFHPLSQDAHPSTALHRAGSADDLRILGLDSAVAEAEGEYKVSEHKKEVRLGLRHRDSFAVHKAHLGADGKATQDSILAAIAGRKNSGGMDSDEDEDEDEDATSVDESNVDAALDDSRRKKSALKSMAKGVGSFLGLRKSKKQRMLEEASRAASESNPAVLPRKCATVSAVIAPTVTAAHQDSTSATPAALDTLVIPTLAPVQRQTTPSGKPPPPSRHPGRSSMTPPPATEKTTSPAPVAVFASIAVPDAPVTPPSPPSTVPSSINTQAPTPPMPPAGSPPSSSKTSQPPRPPPPPPAGPKGAFSPAMSPGTDPVARRHHIASPTRSILKTSAKKTPAPPTPEESGGRRKLSFADHHGHELERVKWCDDLHYSANADHSESEFDPDDPQQKCVIM